MTGERRATIFFLHIPKTAGLTVRQLIWGQYPRGQKFIPTHHQRGQRELYVRYLMEGGEPPSVWKRGKVDPQLRQLAALPPERLAELRVVLGHLWFGIHQAVPGPFTYITVLRDPLDRVLSMYHHRATRHGLAMSVEEYVRSERDILIDNGQTRRLATAEYSDARLGPCTPEMFDSAIANLRAHFSVVGLTERFDLSILAMGRTFGWRKLNYVSFNVSRGRPRVEDLPDDVVATLRRHNEYDLELLRIARERFDEQVEALGIDPARDVAAFRRRLGVYQRVRPIYNAGRTTLARLRRRPIPREVKLRRERGEA